MINKFCKHISVIFLLTENVLELINDLHLQSFPPEWLGTRRQRTESAKKELCFMSGTTATLSTIVHRKCFCCISEQQCSMKFLVSVDFINFPVMVLPSSAFLNSARAEQFRRCFPQHVRTSMPGYRRCQLRPNAPVQELEDSFKRYKLLFLRSTCPYSSRAEYLWHFYTNEEYPFPQTPQFDRPQSKRHWQDQEQSAAGHVACTMRRLA